MAETENWNYYEQNSADGPYQFVCSFETFDDALRHHKNRLEEMAHAERLARRQLPFSDALLFLDADQRVPNSLTPEQLYAIQILPDESSAYVPWVDPIERMEKMHDPGYIYDLTHPDEYDPYDDAPGWVGEHRFYRD